MPGSVLNDRQQRVLAFLATFVDQHGYPPAIRDIQRGCDISSTSVVAYALGRLEQEGCIRRDPRTARAYELLGPHGQRRPRTVLVPLIGRIAAGIPIPFDPDGCPAVTYMEMTEDQVMGRTYLYALRVQGTSLLGALITDGDVVVLEPDEMADAGEMVAATIIDRGETVLARYYPEGARVRLQQQDATRPPFYEDARNVRIEARWVAMVRHYETGWGA